MNALAITHDTAVQMIDTSIVRVHQHGACITRNNRGQSMGRSGGGLTSKIHAVVDTNGLPVRLALTAGDHARSSLLHPAATPLGSLTPAEAPLIDAENLFRQPGPPLVARYSEHITSLMGHFRHSQSPLSSLSGRLSTPASASSEAITF